MVEETIFEQIDKGKFDSGVVKLPMKSPPIVEKKEEPKEKKIGKPAKSSIERIKKFLKKRLESRLPRIKQRPKQKQIRVRLQRTERDVFKPKRSILSPTIGGRAIFRGRDEPPPKKPRFFDKGRF